ncbi:MAG: LutB/LldF family L-lactate oxidation iron-sulfur protein, partial [Actinomycetota bacterium]|nr:LutB/LldF family L-lactate oxidation iron-sulfur protein [Actinomycetota bacterium]
LAQPRERFREIARGALANAHTQAAADGATLRMLNGRLAGWADLPDVEALRERAHGIRMEAVDNLERLHEEFRTALEARGGRVHVAATAEDACAYVAGVCERVGAKLVAKSKSMVSEEIRLNEALETAGVRAVECDLGEYILQLAGEHPVHIILPAIEKTASDVAELFSELEGRPVEPELDPLAAAARRQLREVFLAADVGVTGANFAVAETGSLCLVTNEGNGGLVTSLPRVHIALLGMERIVPRLDDLGVMLKLLPRSATGQKLTSYTRVITGPRREGEADGPDELHVVVVDNGRTNLRRGRYREMLACIRCGACLNVCPVYRKAGGGAYGPVYSGPMGAVLVPLLVGLENAPELPHASSLCGACTAACPVKIPLHELLLDLRRDLVEERVAPLGERLAFALWSLAWSRPALYRLSTALARVGQPLAARFGPGRAWAAGRDLPRFAPRRFRDRVSGGARFRAAGGAGGR